MARPTKYSSVRAGAICGSLRNGATRTASVRAAGVSYDAYLRWMARYPTFSTLVRQAEAECEIDMVRAVWEAAQAGNWRAAFWWLERRCPQEWGLHSTADPEVLARVNTLLEDLFRTDLNEERSL